MVEQKDGKKSLVPGVLAIDLGLVTPLLPGFRSGRKQSPYSLHWVGTGLPDVHVETPKARASSQWEKRCCWHD